jgi:DNA-binding transcriptional regulator YiaG
LPPVAYLSQLSAAFIGVNMIGRELKRARFDLDLTQEQLADLLGVSQQTVSKWERNNGRSAKNVMNSEMDSLIRDMLKSQVSADG